MNTDSNENALETKLEGNNFPSKKKVHFETWGCQMNVADSEAMLNQMLQQNFELVHKADDADVVVLNTCHIREKAKHKVMSRLGELRELKETTKKDLKIAITGCVAQAEGKKIAEQAPFVDVVLGPGHIPEFFETFKKSEQNKTQEVKLGFKRNHSDEHDHSKNHLKTNSVSAIPSITGRKEVIRFVNIMAGCNNYCTFCVVPFTRGKEVSRPKSEILNEVQAMLEDGAKEIHLLGQNVNSYGHDLLDTKSLHNPSLYSLTKENIFTDLLQSVANMEGIERVRFTTSNPHDFTTDLAKLFSTEKKMGKYLHLPVQSGSNSILESMKRKVTREEYLEKINWLRTPIPDMAISTDIIVGFPGESDEDFEQTMDLIKQVRFSFVFAFKYSPRKNTAAIRFSNQIPEDIKSKRLLHLNQVQDRITMELNQEQIGKQCETLIVYEKKSEPGIFYGRTEHFRAVRIACNHNIVGKTLGVKIVGTTKNTLQGELIH